MRFLLSVLLALTLSACFVSEHALITDGDAAMPLKEGRY